jgi:hypothetical protein
MLEGADAYRCFRREARTVQDSPRLCIVGEIRLVSSEVWQR